MHQRIEAGRLLTEQEEREVKAALALAGHTQESFSKKKAKSFTRVNRMITRKEVITPEYAKVFNDLIRSTLGRYNTVAA